MAKVTSRLRLKNGNGFRGMGRSIAFLAIVSLAAGAQAQIPTQFDFGTGAPAAGYTKVTPATVYSTTLGYGFQPSKSPITAVSRSGSDVFADYCTSADSFSFSLNLPLGNYTATV
jgi:hypothetical protein